MVNISKKHKKLLLIVFILGLIIIISVIILLFNKHNIIHIFQNKKYVNLTNETLYGIPLKDIIINCSGSFYYLKKNKEIDSVYLVIFNYTGNGSLLNSTLNLNISYYGLNIKYKYTDPEIFVFIYEVLDLISRGKFIYVEYSKIGNLETYKINLYENKKEYSKILNELLHSNNDFNPYIKDFLNYNLHKDSYIFIKIENKQLKYIEGYIKSFNQEKNNQIILFFKCNINYTHNITYSLFKQYFLSQKY